MQPEKSAWNRFRRSTKKVEPVVPLKPTAASTPPIERRGQVKQTEADEEEEDGEDEIEDGQEGEEEEEYLGQGTEGSTGEKGKEKSPQRAGQQTSSGGQAQPSQHGSGRNYPPSAFSFSSALANRSQTYMPGAAGVAAAGPTAGNPAGGWRSHHSDGHMPNYIMAPVPNSIREQAKVNFFKQINAKQNDIAIIEHFAEVVKEQQSLEMHGPGAAVAPVIHLDYTPCAVFKHSKAEKKKQAN